MPAPSLKIDRRALIASAVLSAFVGVASVTAAIAPSPAQAAEKSGGKQGATQTQQTQQKQDCNKYPKDSQDYKTCMSQ